MHDASEGGASGPQTLAGAVSSLLDGDLEALSDAELSGTIVEIEQAQAALDAARLRYLHEWDNRSAWRHDGASSGGAWLAARSGAAHSTARERIRVAHGAAAMAIVTAALAAGRLTWSKVRLFSQIIPDAAASAFAEHEQMLVDKATTLSVEHTRAMLHYWAARADPDGHDNTEKGRYETRKLHLSATLDGTHAINGGLTAETSLVVKTELDRLSDLLYKDETEPDLVRTAAQRLHDCLHEMAIRSASYDDTKGRRATPSLLAVVQYEALAEATAMACTTGPPLSGAAANRLACNAGISRIITGPNSEILDKGREARLFNEAQRRALLVRYLGCAFPDCDRPPGWTEAHHIGEWTKDHGPTDLANGAPLCPCHHRYVHEGGGSITVNCDGSLTFYRPDGSVIEPGWKALAGLI
jgi:hypothetical protein